MQKAKEHYLIAVIPAYARKMPVEQSQHALLGCTELQRQQISSILKTAAVTIRIKHTSFTNSCINS